jgi:hypothetical protein
MRRLEESRGELIRVDQGGMRRVKESRSGMAHSGADESASWKGMF